MLICGISFLYTQGPVCTHVLKLFQITTIMYFTFTLSYQRKEENAIKAFCLSANYVVQFRKYHSPAHRSTCISLQGNTTKNQYYYSECAVLFMYICVLIFFLCEDEYCMIYTWSLKSNIFFCPTDSRSTV